MKNYTKNEESCIGRLLKQIFLDDAEESLRDLHEVALKNGVRIDRCTHVVEFLLDNQECLDVWLKSKESC